MISKTKIREILKDQKLTDEQIESLRNDMYVLAELLAEEMPPEGGSKNNVWVIDSSNQKGEHGK